MGPNETVEIRRALDRLQQSFEILSDRYRDLRRERKQLRERIEELHRERDTTSAANFVQLEMAEKDRRRATELEERAAEAERLSGEFFNRVADLEQTIAERELLIAEQEDSIVGLRTDNEVWRAKGDEAWMQGEHLREELDDLRRQLGQARAESESYRAQLEQITTVGEGEIALPAAALEEMRTESASLRAMITQLRDERSDMEAKHLQAIGKLDAATLAETMARTEVATMRQEKTSLEDALAAQRETSAVLEGKLADAIQRGGDSTAVDAELEARREHEMNELHGALAREQETHAAAVAQLQERIAAADLERESLERQARELRDERDTGRQNVDGLRMALRQAEAGDDERLRAQRVRIEELQRDLSQTLDVAARKEVEAARISQDLEVAQERLARLSEELALLKEGHGEGNGVVSGSALGDEERLLIAEKIDTAIRMIDRHLQNE